MIIIITSILTVLWDKMLNMTGYTVSHLEKFKAIISDRTGKQTPPVLPRIAK